MRYGRRVNAGFYLKGKGKKMKKKKKKGMFCLKDLMED